tara:strand:+ start:393 stop:1238 length:846 start_codon:yes stop_codon:yes gene_type:complete
MSNERRYLESCYLASENLTKKFSTSFSLGIFCLDKKIRKYVYAIYGLVRVGDEIVDTFFNIDQRTELDLFEKQAMDSIKNKYSSNMVLHAFQDVVNKFNITEHLIKSFFESMRMDLNDRSHNEETYKKYIFGSAEVVGLMCLHIFTNGDKNEFNSLEKPAKRLGSAFQKVNFLRDISEDYQDKGRSYFPNLDLNMKLSEDDKKIIIEDIENDFSAAYFGIKKLPKTCRFGVTMAYKYYLQLLLKIKKTSPEKIISSRIRISNLSKLLLLISTSLKSILKIN